MVRLPDAAGQIRNAPVKALRGLFAGVGQLLITADRFRAEEAQREQAAGERARDERTETGRAEAGRAKDGRAQREQGRDLDDGDDRYEPLMAPRAPAVRRSHDGRAGRHRANGLRGPAASAQDPTRRFRSLDSTGNVRLLTADEPVRDPDEDRPAAAEGIGADAAAASAPYGAVTARAGLPLTAADLPVPGYDRLTVGSLRSRLRYLDAGQLRMLAEYERAAANRAEVVGMFERRIAKLQAADPHAP